MTQEGFPEIRKPLFVCPAGIRSDGAAFLSGREPDSRAAGARLGRPRMPHRKRPAASESKKKGKRLVSNEKRLFLHPYEDQRRPDRNARFRGRIGRFVARTAWFSFSSPPRTSFDTFLKTSETDWEGREPSQSFGTVHMNITFLRTRVNFSFWSSKRSYFDDI